MTGKRIVSYSQYSIYKTCPYQWYLRYVQRHPSDPTIHLVFGTSLHTTVQKWLEVMYTVSGKASDELDLPALLKASLIEEYTNRVQANNSVHFSTAQELQEFYEDGVLILEWLKKRRKEYFSIRNTELVGIEIPILVQAVPGIANVEFKAAIDLILYSKLTDTYTIYDIKTSTRGWTPEDKKNQQKLNQLLLYKRLFSEKRKIPEDKVDVLFFIVKRKIPVDTEYPVKRVQEVVPAHGVRKVEQAYTDFQQFVEECFTPEGTFQDRKYFKNAGDACRWCKFGKDNTLCDKQN